MSETASSLTVLPPGKTDLAELASKINAAHDGVRTALRNGLGHAIEAGKFLLQAKLLVKFGHWEEWIGANCRFSDRTVQLYMQVASNELLLMAKAQNFADLTLGDAVKLLAPMQSPDLPTGRASSSGGKRTKRNPIADAIKADPLAIMEKAWAALSPNEKDIFRSKIANEPPDLMPRS